MESAGVNSVPEHSYGREVVSDAGVVLNVVEPSCHVQILLLLLDGQVHLRGEEVRLRKVNPFYTVYTVGKEHHALIFYTVKQ